MPDNQPLSKEEILSRIEYLKTLPQGLSPFTTMFKMDPTLIPSPGQSGVPPLSASPELQTLIDSASAAEQKYPSMVKMAWGLNTAVVSSLLSFVKQGGVVADQALVDTRIATCTACDFYDVEANRCTKCGCFMSVKTRLKAVTCPVGKW